MRTTSNVTIGCEEIMDDPTALTPRVPTGQALLLPDRQVPGLPYGGSGHRLLDRRRRRDDQRRRRRRTGYR